MTQSQIDTGTSDLLASLDAGVLTLTLNRPDARNAMSRAMTQALADQLAAAELDPAVRCIVLTGAGKGFCAGGDVKGMAAAGDGTVGNRKQEIKRSFRTTRTFEHSLARLLIRPYCDRALCAEPLPASSAAKQVDPTDKPNGNLD